MGPVALGVDAAGNRGWVGVVVGAAGFVLADLAPTVAELIEKVEATVAPAVVSCVGIDIPIGLVDGPSRSADVAARVYVGPRSSSVFPAPHPAVVDLDEHAEVNRVLRGLGYPGISIQGFRLFPRIREVAALAHDPRVVEVFPEASFRALAGAPVTSTKKSWAGMAHRRSLLASASPPIVVPDDIGPAGRVPVDDVLDAAAAAWSAWRVVIGEAEAHGDPAEADPATGRRIAMWV